MFTVKTFHTNETGSWMNAYEIQHFGVQAHKDGVCVTGGPCPINVLDHEFVIVENSSGQTTCKLSAQEDKNGDIVVRLPCGSIWRKSQQ